MKEVLNDIYTDGCKEKKYRLSDFFNRWWDEYAQHPAAFAVFRPTRCVPPLPNGHRRRSAKSIASVMVKTSRFEKGYCLF